MELVFIDIDNTLLDFDEYIRRTMREGFAHFGLKPYEPYMEEIFHRENGKLWRQIEQGTLTFAELERIRWNNVFAALDIDFDGTVFETYFRAALYDSAIPVPEGEREPMMNILCYATPAGIRMVVIPRKRHRPSFYGTEGKDCMLLSPASVDMGGVFITPRPEDFERMDADIIRRIYNELCLNLDEITAIASNVK